MGLPTEELKAFGVGLGFQTVGVAPALPSSTAEAYAAWVDAGFNGEMAYLAKHTALKKSPEALLPGLKTVIAVALNYNQANPHVPGQPRIARYALGRDYSQGRSAKTTEFAILVKQNPPGSRVPRLRRFRSVVRARVCQSSRSRVVWQEHVPHRFKTR